MIKETQIFLIFLPVPKHYYKSREVKGNYKNKSIKVYPQCDCADEPEQSPFFQGI